MKEFLILLPLLSLSVSAAKFGFEDVNTFPVTWRFYVGTNSGQYMTNFPIVTTNFTIGSSNLFPGRTNFAMATAVDQTGSESDPSNEIKFLVPVAPRNFKLSLESSGAPSGPWSEQASISVADEGLTTRFFRGKVFSQ